MSASEQNPQIRAQSKRPSESICANPQANSTHDTAGDLLAQLDQTRDDLADLLLEIDHIELQVNPQILNDYNVKIACFENDLLKAEIEVRRAKRNSPSLRLRSTAAKASPPKLSKSSSKGIPLNGRRN